MRREARTSRRDSPLADVALATAGAIATSSGLDVTTVLFANRAYASLKHELFNVGARNPGRKALDMLDIGRPDLDWVSLARGMGVEAGRATSNAEFIQQLRAGLASEGPYLIEAVI